MYVSMRMWRKSRLIKEECGQALVLVALLMSILLGFSALIIDVGRVYVEKAKLQNAVDAAALAGAQDLSNTSKAEISVKKYIEDNGYFLENVVITFPESDTIKITTDPVEIANYNNENPDLTAKNAVSIDYTFAQILGFDNTNLKVSAAASKIETGESFEVFDYAVFSEQTITLEKNGASSDGVVIGNLYSGDDLVFNNNGIIIKGTVNLLGNITNYGNKNAVVGEIKKSSASIFKDKKGPLVYASSNNNATTIPLPEIASKIIDNAEYLIIESEDILIENNKIKVGTKETPILNNEINATIYSSGNIIIKQPNLKINGSIIADNKITINDSGLTAESIYSKYSGIGNAITVDITNNAILSSILYAPFGRVYFPDNNKNTLYGSIIANAITFPKNSTTIDNSQGNEDFVNKLREYTIKLIE